VVFGEPTIVPGPPIKAEVVRERLAFRAGETFRPSALAETERALYELPIVERVIIEPVGLERGDTVVSPRIVVEPRKVSAIQLEGTLSSTECLELAVFWANRYFLGGPRLFSLGVGFANLFANTFNEKFPCTSTGTGVYANPNYFVQANLRQPWPHHPRTQLLVEGFYTRQSEAQAYVQRGYGGQLGIARQFSPALMGTYLYSPKRRELKGASFYFCGDFGICDVAGLDEQSEFRWESPVDALTSWTPTGPPVTVRRAVEGERWRGWMRNGLSGSANATGSSYNYFRGIEEGAATRLFGTSSELAARARVGALMGQRVLPPTARLYSGGAYTVRGVSQNLLGPKLLSIAPEDVAAQGCTLAPNGCPPGTVANPDLVTVRATGGRAVTEANLEWRLWLGERLQLAMFADFGVLWRNFIHSDTREFGGTFSESLITPGVGVRILTGMGPIRVDVGYDPVGKRSYPLFVQQTNGPVIFLGDVTYDPYTFGNPGWFTEFWRRLQFQVAIGQPF
jgi:outer membrane protein assembly factor BamA